MFCLFVSDAIWFSICAEGIDHGSRYAKSLGFEGETSWPVDGIDTKKKNKNKKKVGLNGIEIRIFVCMQLFFCS